MKNVARHLVLAGLSAFVCFFSSCTIKDDNGNPVDPGQNVVTPNDPSFTPGLNILPDSNYVIVGGTIRILVQLLADEESPVRNARIDVATTFGTLSSNRVTTDANGWATVNLTGSREGIAEVTFRYGNIQEIAFISISDTPPRNISINASPSVLMADGISTSTITVQVKNDNNNPIVGDSIRFAVSAGMITAAGVTDEDGKATAKLTSDRRNTVATVTAALRDDATRSARINVEFSGVTITAVPAPTSIKADGSDTSVVLITLTDAAGNSIVGERVTFLKQLDSTIFINPDLITNSRGEARVKVVKRPNRSGDNRFMDTITVTAAGASARTVLIYSNHNVTITPAAGQSFIANPAHETTFEINGGSNMDRATFEVSVTMGTTVNGDGDVVFADILTAGTNGRASFTMQNPAFTSFATIFVRAIPRNSSGEFTTASYTQYFQASIVKKIELSGTPSVINTSGQPAKITATAFDSLGNRVRDAIISFNMLSGPGGGERLEPATATTAADGTASTYLIPGTIPSSFKGVRIKASDFAGNESNTISFTIAGPPHSIAIDRNFGELVSYPAAYGKKIAALVSDINGNPVADGTEVTFSAQVTAYRFFTRQPFFGFETDSNGVITYTYRVDIIPTLIQSEWINQNRPYTPFPPFNDINWSGVPERWSPDLDNPHNWDSWGNPRRNNPIKPCHPQLLTQVGRIMTCPPNGFVDHNGNREWDTIKTFTRHNDFSGAELDAFYNAGRAILENQYAPGNYTNWDIDWIGNGIPEPQSTILITRVVPTKDGIADNELVYGQSAALRYEVRVLAECQGLVTHPEQWVLTIEEDAAKYWTYRP